VAYIANEFKENSLQNADWLDEPTRLRSIEKLNEMGHEVVYPDFILNDTALHDYYMDIVLPNRTGGLLVNVVDRCSYGMSVSIMKRWVARKADRKMWPTGPQVVNAFYNPNANSIFFPGGILYPPFYHPDLPKYVATLKVVRLRRVNMYDVPRRMCTFGVYTAHVCTCTDP
jgi:predicted metalloendopeptidase